jgi:hypothetical protein
MKKIIILLVVVLLSAEVYSQQYKEFNTGFITIFKNPAEINSYYFGNNPAVLSFEPEDELLSLKTQVDVDDGKFKRFIDPVSNRDYQLIASGKKAIDESQRFKGSFAFQRFERKNWTWFFTRDYQTGNPFLLGDSTTGDTRINGIAMNAEYSINLSEKFSAGASLDYSVDETLKEISPRPTSVHRNIHSRIALNYLFTSSISLGIIADVYDKMERIAYREDEGALLQETIILKFKGYDFPNVFRKKTETRYSYINGYAAGLTFSHILPHKSSLAGYILTGFDKTNIKDDAVLPKAEGFWKNDYLNAGLQLLMHPFNNYQIGFKYNFHSSDGWAKYSPFNVLYYERNFDIHSFTGGIQYALSRKIAAGIEGGISLTALKEEDHYSALFNNVKENILYARTGFSIDWNDDISSIISYGYSNKSVPEYSYNAEGESDYFINYRQYDLTYLRTGYNKHNIVIASKINPWFGGYIYLYLDYSLINPESGSAFGNENKSQFKSTIEYRVKVF